MFNKEFKSLTTEELVEVQGGGYFITIYWGGRDETVGTKNGWQDLGRWLAMYERYRNI
mgnify:FL=1